MNLLSLRFCTSRSVQNLNQDSSILVAYTVLNYFQYFVTERNDLKFKPNKGHPEEVKLGSEGEVVIQNEVINIILSKLCEN